METIILVVHVFVALAVVGMVLIQLGKGAEAGAGFGSGASQTVFGSQGSASFLGKLTALLALVFFITSFSLALIGRDKASDVIIDSVTVVEEVAGDAPIAAEEVEEASVSDAPVIQLEQIEDTTSENNSAQPQAEKTES